MTGSALSAVGAALGGDGAVVAVAVGAQSWIH